MATTTDAFIDAVDNARRELIRQEGANVSVREIIRRAGFTDGERPGVAYHLNRRRHDGTKPHRVPLEVVNRLAAVLPVSKEDLHRAAAVASGLTVVDREPLTSEVEYVVARFAGNDEVTDAEWQATSTRLLQIIAKESARRLNTESDDSPAVG